MEQVSTRQILDTVDAPQFKTERGFATPESELANTPPAPVSPEEHLQSLSPSVIIGMIAVSDAAIVILSGLISFEVRDVWYSPALPIYAWSIVLNTAILLTIFRYAGLYHIDAFTRRRQQVQKILVSCITAFLLIAALAFAFKLSETFSRVWAFTWLAVLIGLIIVSRSCYLALLNKAAKTGMLSRNVAVVGAGVQGQRLVEILQKNSNPWLSIVGIYDDRTDRVSDTIDDFPVLGDLERLGSDIRQNRIDDVFIALPWNAEVRLKTIVETLSELPVEIHITSDLIGFSYPNAKMSSVSGVATLNVARKPLADWNYVLKQFEDYILASIFLIFLAPLMLLIAAAIKLDSPGPIIFRQKRYGYNNHVIEVLKFRTMQFNRPADIGVPQAKQEDPRITRVGRILRRTSLDELPQLINVLNGSMSLIGPRPHAIAHNIEYSQLVSRYFARHRVKPGMTGWAQVNGFRGETDTTEKMSGRVEHDLHYIENWSLLLDLRILFETVGVVLSQKNAY